MFDNYFTLVEYPHIVFWDAIISIKLHTDRKSLLEVVSKGTTTAEEILILDIAVARERL